MSRLEAQLAVVTGAASGIGQALALELRARGAEVAALDVDAEGLARLAAQTGARPFTCDVTDEASVDRVARAIGPVDLLFANAGVAAMGGLSEVPLDDARWVIDVNLIGAMIVARRFAPAMIEAGRGNIVFTASIAGLIGVPGMSAYSASKFAVVGFSEALRGELVGTGVGVTTICPGYVRTGLHRATRYHSPTFQRLLDDPPAMMRGLDKSAVARRAVDAALAGEAVVPMGVERVAATLGRLSPRFYARAAAGLRRLLKQRR